MSSCILRTLAVALVASTWLNGTARGADEVSPEAIKGLREALKDKDAEVRKSAVLALGRIGKDASAAVPELTDSLKDSDVDVRGAAALALGASAASRPRPYPGWSRYSRTRTPTFAAPPRWHCARWQQHARRTPRSRRPCRLG